MVYFSLILRMILKLKLELVILSLFSCFVIIYTSNPYAINPVEFSLYTKYIVPIGIIIWFLASYRLHTLIFESVSLEWVAINKVTQRPKYILVKQIVVAFFYFLIIHLIIACLIAINNVIIFSSGIDLFLFIFIICLIYFVLPFGWGWCMGFLISTINAQYSYKKGLLLASLFMLWTLSTFLLEYKSTAFNTFIENRVSYIDPIFNLSFLDTNVVIKIIYLLSLIGIFFVFIKNKNTVLGYSLCLVLIMCVTFVSYYIQEQSYLEKTLLYNDGSLYQIIKQEDYQTIETKNNNWRITGVKVEAEAKHPIEIEITLDEAIELTTFYINEQFKIAYIKSQDENLIFEQQRNRVVVNTQGVRSMQLYYESTIGTSFYPLMSNSIFLPYESNWYPRSNSLENYHINSSGALDLNIEMNTCGYVDLVVGKEKLSWSGDGLDCLSIIKGPYKQIQLQETQLIIYQPFLTKRSNYKDLVDHLEAVRNELCKLLPHLKNSTYCSVYDYNILIVPKSLNTNPISKYDSTISNGHYTFYVNPFLDVNNVPVTTQIKELSSFLIPYRILGDEKLSILVSQYLIEKLDVENVGYLDWVIDDISEIPDLDSFQILEAKEKENVLIQMASEGKIKD